MKNSVPSPGARLEQLLDERGIKNTQLAEDLGRSPQYVTDIIKGKKALDVDLAIQLEKALGGKPTAQQWMRWVIEHKQSVPTLTRIDLLNKYEYAKELIKLKWIDGKQSLEDLDKELSAFWALKSKVANFKQSPGQKRPADPTARTAWAIEVYRRAGEIPRPRYDESKFDHLVSDLQGLMSTEADVMKVQGLLHSYGIALILLPNPPKCAVDGVAWFNDGQPYIGMSLRVARLDSFWFTLMHEAMHIYHKDQQMHVDTIDRLALEKPEERRANDSARQVILADDEYEAFVDQGIFTLTAIEEAASKAKHKIHPSILLGRLKNDLILDWSQFAREHPGVRDLVLNASR